MAAVLASSQGHFNVVRYLLEAGAWVEPFDEDSVFMSPLMCAAEQGHVEIAEYLLDQGADPASAAALAFVLQNTTQVASMVTSLRFSDAPKIVVDAAQPEVIKQPNHERQSRHEGPGSFCFSKAAGRLWLSFNVGSQYLVMTESVITYQGVSEADFDALVQLRIEAMRESLENLGRFDPVRARERLRKTFEPRATEWIVCDGEKAGFYAMRRVDSRYLLEHLYIHPRFQRKGIGSRTLSSLKTRARGEKVVIEVGALRGSDSNRFYRREGFTKTSEDEWDIYYIYKHADGERA